MEIYFIRHAQSTNNVLWDQNGSAEGRVEDPLVTEIGKKQIQILAEYISRQTESNPNGRPDDQNRYGFPLTHLYASPMVRALETGLAVAQATGLPLTWWKDLHEGGGIFLKNDEGEMVGLPGKPRHFFTENYPDVILTEEIKPKGWWNQPFEPYDQRKKRAERVWEKIITNHQPNDKIALCSHGGFFNYFLSFVLDREITENVWVNINNASISRFNYDPDRRRVELFYFNKTDHLSDDLIT